MLAFMAFGCGSPTANLEITAPSGAIVGTPFTVTVTAMVNGRRDTAYNSPIHFSSSDSSAVLPPDYGFTAADAGSHTFTNGVTLMSVGNQTVKATDVFAASLSATANVTVSDATANKHFNVCSPSTMRTASSIFNTELFTSHSSEMVAQDVSGPGPARDLCITDLIHNLRPPASPLVRSFPCITDP
jgi:hypothetical protein